MESIRRQFALSLFALSLCALAGGARAADAQGVEAIVPTSIDSVRSTIADLAPTIRPASGILLRESRMAAAASEPRAVVAPVVGRSWKMPTSRTLMIGGTAAALIGLVAVKGDAGAIVALAGGGVAVYGLYLHYNR